MEKTIGATEASNRFGRLLDMARSEPVTIEKKGRAVAVIMAVEEFERMEGELERFHDLRLRESIADMKAERTHPADEVFGELKKRYE